MHLASQKRGKRKKKQATRNRYARRRGGGGAQALGNDAESGWGKRRLLAVLVLSGRVAGRQTDFRVVRRRFVRDDSMHPDYGLAMIYVYGFKLTAK